MYRFVLSSLVIVILFSGCISMSNLPQKDRKTNFSLLSYKLASRVCENIKPNSTLYITDFVNESNFKNISQLGFLLSSELKVNILKSSCTTNVTVKNLQLSKTLKIGNHGTRILTRDFSNIKVKNIKDNNQMLVGTYMMTKNQFIVFLKLINLKDSSTISSSSVSTPITNEIKELEGIDTTDEPYVYTPLHI